MSMAGDGKNPNASALLLGSHLDTVVDAGKFDGAFGIISSISAMKVLKVNDMLKGLTCPVEEIACINTTNHQKNEDMHTLGPRSIARLRHELAQKNPNKKQLADSVVYKESRKIKSTHAYKTTGCKNKENIVSCLMSQAHNTLIFFLIYTFFLPLYTNLKNDPWCSCRPPVKNLGVRVSHTYVQFLLISTKTLLN